MLDETETSAHLNGADPIGSLGWLASVLVAGGSVVVIAGNTPERAARERVRDLVPGFVEVFVDGGPGPDAYEEPFAPELRVPTLDRDEAASTAQLVSWLEDAGVFPPEA
jgi:adenylylsulfate kinase-like enzyme